ncbi:MAG: ABC transporter permease subunit [Bdellovibrionota bacterium]
MIKKARFDNPTLPYLLLAPQLLITLLFFIYPAFEAVRQAFFLSDPYGAFAKFVGLDNFLVLLGSADFWASLWRSIVLGSATAFLAMSSGLLLAVLVLRLAVGRKLAQSLLLWPYALAPAVSGVLWLFLFHPTYGALGYLVTQMGIDWNPVLKGSHAMLLVIMASSWKQISYNFVFFLSALQAVPASVLEAASLDGAGPIKRFWIITFPLLSPTIFFLATMNMVYALFDTFGTIHATTEGGPGGATKTLVYKVYTDGFVAQDLGMSAAESVVLMFMTILLTWVQFSRFEKKVSYGAK